jgi:general stress protein YciG
MAESTTNRGGQKRGFAAMDAEKRRRIASEGGKAAHQSGKAHKWTSTEAREAGRKGGKATHAARREFLENGELRGEKANEEDEREM